MANLAQRFQSTNKQNNKGDSHESPLLFPMLHRNVKVYFGPF